MSSNNQLSTEELQEIEDQVSLLTRLAIHANPLKLYPDKFQNMDREFRNTLIAQKIKHKQETEQLILLHQQDKEPELLYEDQEEKSYDDTDEVEVSVPTTPIPTIQNKPLSVNLSGRNSTTVSKRNSTTSVYHEQIVETPRSLIRHDAETPRSMIQDRYTPTHHSTVATPRSVIQDRYTPIHQSTVVTPRSIIQDRYTETSKSVITSRPISRASSNVSCIQHSEIFQQRQGIQAFIPSPVSTRPIGSHHSMVSSITSSKHSSPRLQSYNPSLLVNRSIPTVSTTFSHMKKTTDLQQHMGTSDNNSLPSLSFHAPLILDSMFSRSHKAYSVHSGESTPIISRSDYPESLLIEERIPNLKDLDILMKHQPASQKVDTTETGDVLNSYKDQQKLLRIQKECREICTHIQEDFATYLVNQDSPIEEWQMLRADLKEKQRIYDQLEIARKICSWGSRSLSFMTEKFRPLTFRGKDWGDIVDKKLWEQSIRPDIEEIVQNSQKPFIRSVPREINLLTNYVYEFISNSMRITKEEGINPPVQNTTHSMPTHNDSEDSSKRNRKSHRHSKKRRDPENQISPEMFSTLLTQLHDLEVKLKQQSSSTSLPIVPNNKVEEIVHVPIPIQPVQIEKKEEEVVPIITNLDSSSEKLMIPETKKEEKQILTNEQAVAIVKGTTVTDARARARELAAARAKATATPTY